MKSKYRFRHPKGRNIQVSFVHLPGKWLSTGTNSMQEAVLWAEEKMQLDLKQKTRKPKITLNEFAQDFFSAEDPHGYRLRNEKRNRNYSNDYYFSHQSRLDNYILPQFGSFLINAITDVMIEDWMLALSSYRKELNSRTILRIKFSSACEWCFKKLRGKVIYQAIRRGMFS